MRITCDATLGAGCDNAGLVFGYQDRQNYWVKVYSNAQDSILLYQVSGGTWTRRSSDECAIADDTEFTMTGPGTGGTLPMLCEQRATRQLGALPVATMASGLSALSW